MIFHSYYYFKKTIGKSRFDCIASTQNYSYFETRLLNKIKYNVGGLSINLGEVSEHINNDRHRCTQALSRSANISKLFLFDIENPTLFYGDSKDTTDALIIILSSDCIEIFVSPNNKGIQVEICSQVANGCLDEEMNLIKSKAIHYDLPQWR